MPTSPYRMVVGPGSGDMGVPGVNVQGTRCFGGLCSCVSYVSVAYLRSRRLSPSRLLLPALTSSLAESLSVFVGIPRPRGELQPRIVVGDVRAGFLAFVKEAFLFDSPGLSALHVFRHQRPAPPRPQPLCILSVRPFDCTESTWRSTCFPRQPVGRAPVGQKGGAYLICTHTISEKNKQVGLGGDVLTSGVRGFNTS